MWIQEQLPIRMAHRLSDFLRLPYVIICNTHVHEAFRNMFEAYETLADSPRIRDASSVDEFAVMLHGLVRSHDKMIYVMQEGYSELRSLFDDLVDLEDFLDRVFITRIGNRVLCEHFLAVHEARSSGCEGGATGVVQPECCPADIVEDLSQSIGQVCGEVYGVVPKTILEGQLDTRFSFIPDHLSFIVQEVMKNAFRATIESHPGKMVDLPPINVEIMKGSFDMTIKISDAGGGMKRETLNEIWRYGFTSTTEESASTHVAGELAGLSGMDAVSKRQIAGYGFGMPLSRVYAQYFGGDITVQSMRGYGTDVFVNVNHLGDKQENEPESVHLVRRRSRQDRLIGR